MAQSYLCFKAPSVGKVVNGSYECGKAAKKLLQSSRKEVVVFLRRVEARTEKWADQKGVSDKLSHGGGRGEGLP